MPRTWMYLLLSAFLQLAQVPAASAQSAPPAVAALRTARAPRARVRAVQDIARTRPPGAREALEEALLDRAASVRRAAAMSLGELGDPSAMPALDRMAGDRDRAVQRAALASRRALETLAPQGHMHGSTPVGVGASAAAPRAPVDWRQVRVIVSLGSLANPAGAPGDQLAHLRAALASAVESTPGFALHTGTLPAAGQARLRSRAARWYSLEGSLASLQVQREGVVRVRAELSMAILQEPQHNIIGTLSTAATAQEQPLPQAMDPSPRLARTALETVARGAIQRMQGQFIPAGARAR